jgi:sugar lactone lactonase YvrE
MTLAAGAKLGPYEILSPLGSGGMGEVWKAKDARLDRFVAIKVLPDHLTANADALARFEREAKAVAALNHPNITGIFDIGREGSTVFAVMELLEGESLRTRLAQGPLAPRLAIDLTTQLAHGLAAAHEKGVIHRDLKPDNLWITKDGRLKILDFGLAKQVPAFGGGSGSLMPTEAMAAGSPLHTEEGMILGTVGYMSPEQVRGEVVDARSDLFAFGVVLFEMLTGRKAFARGTTADTLAAILKEEPPDLEQTSRPIPAGLQRILHRCLEKQPGHRFHDAEDLAFALTNLESGVGSSASLAAPFAPSHRRTTLVWAGAVGLALVAALGAGWALRSSAAPQPTFRKLTFGRGAIDGGRFVPGSKDIAFSARWQGAPSKVFLLREGSMESRALDSEGAFLLAVSAQGSTAVLTKPNLNHGVLEGSVQVQSLAGGGSRSVMNRVWAAEFAEDGASLCLVTLGPSSSYLLQWPPGETLHTSKHMLRTPRIRGGMVAFFEEGDQSLTDGALRVMTKGSAPRTLAPVTGLTSLAWGPDGKELWFSTYDGSESTFQAVSMAGRTRVLLRHAGRLELMDVDRGGRALAIASSHQRQTFGRAPGAAKETDLTWLDAQVPMALSADGAQLLMARYGDWQMADAANLYLVPMGGGPGVTLGTGSVDAHLSWDRRWVATFERNAKGENGVRLLPTGAGTSRWLALGKSLTTTDGLWFHPDGSKIYVSDSVNSNLARLQLDSGAVQTGAVQPRMGSFNRQEILSPDGRRFLKQPVDVPAAGEDEGEALEIFVDGEPKGAPVMGNLRGEAVAGWAENSREAYVWDRNTLPAQVFRLDTATGQRRPSLQINPADPSGVMGVQILKVTPTGHAYAYSVVRKLSDLYLIEGVK